ncbi:MAG: nucleotidyltransferase family protein [Cyanobacteria bacterium P01_H01_bin.15]
MSLASTVQSKREDILAIASRYGASNIRVFGSVARGEANRYSDVDFLVDFEPQRTLIDAIALTQELETLLDCSVDVTEPNCLHELIRDRVLNEAVSL